MRKTKGMREKLSETEQLEGVRNFEKSGNLRELEIREEWNEK